MFLTVRRRRHAQKVFEYLDICENRRVQGKVVRSTLWTLGRKDQLDPKRIDSLIELLRKLASPEGRRGVRVGELQMKQVREYGSALVARRLWSPLEGSVATAQSQRNPSLEDRM